MSEYVQFDDDYNPDDHEATEALIARGTPPGEKRIDKMREIVQNRSAAMVDGALVDMQSASLFVQIYDRVLPSVQVALNEKPILAVLRRCWRAVG